MRESKLAYEPAIDGLRAIAVGGVILFHLGVPGVGGGFVGVDVFFVISGFLIGSIIERQIRSREFSLSNFYMRRVRRLVPALLFMLSGAMLLACLHLPPVEMAAFARSVIAALLFSSNLYFWRQPGYFEPAADTQPLLHTWSLGIEEQFYLLFPIAVIALHRWAPRRGWTIVVVATLLSFVASSIAVIYVERSAFFLLPTRAWELLLGYLLALHMLARPVAPGARRMWPIAGLALIMAAMIGFPAGIPFPGPAALVPCLGAVLIIGAGSGNGGLVERGLTLPPMVFLGRISYPLYLWHWPLLVFQKHYGMVDLPSGPIAEGIVVLMASFVMAVLSWRFLERPITAHIGFGRKLVLRGVGGATLLMGLAAAGAAATGYPGRFTPTERRMLSFLDYDPTAAYRDGRCMISSGSTAGDFDAVSCLKPGDPASTYLLMGDSHAAHLWWGFAKTLPTMTIMQATASGCRPVLHGRDDEWPECRKIMEQVFQDVLAPRAVTRLILSARWEMRDRERLGATLAWLRDKGIEVVLIGPMVEYDAPVPRLLLRAGAEPDGILARHRLDSRQEVDAVLAETAAQYGAAYVSVYDLMCARPYCMALDQGTALQFDNSHVTARGSVQLAQLIGLPTLFGEAGQSRYQ